MDLTDRLIDHDAWLTRRILEKAASLTEAHLAAPLPVPELALGNVVRLKKPHRAGEGRRAGEFTYGVIAEHTPSALLSEDDKAVNLSNTVGILMAAVKAQQKEIAGLQAQVRALRHR